MAHIKQRIIRFWNWIGNLGGEYCTTPQDLKSVRFVNRLAFMGGTISLPYCLSLIYKFGVFDIKINLISICLTLVFFTIPYINKNGFLFTGKAICCVVPIVFLLFNGVWVGRDDAVPFLFIPSAILPLILFQNKSAYLVFFILNAISFFLLNFYLDTNAPLIVIPPDFLKMTFISNMLLLFLFLYLMIHYFKETNNIYEQELILSQAIIEEKNTDITASITYAKRIQEAKLPNIKEIQNALPDSFVLFKPKDIVSGDFYYLHKNEKTVFIASADCTGHGVPGALMSMIGSEKLDDALAQSTDTSQILSYLNKGIKFSLKQTDSEESTRDGMDIALCSVDTEARVVKYAGANRPIYFIRQGQKVIEEIKATKKAIGGLTEDNQHFETHSIQLRQGDAFYIFSDGYADTFSGKSGKKLTTKKFKEILIEINEKTMSDQELFLNDFIEEWKKGTEQVDDILIIGVRL
jgi:serine phosphatase RsbU (regulator of sigma subunit)